MSFFNLISLDEIKSDENKAILVFNTNLKKQFANITEVGEEKVTSNLQKSFHLLEKNRNDEKIKAQIRQDIFAIMKFYPFTNYFNSFLYLIRF